MRAFIRASELAAEGTEFLVDGVHPGASLLVYGQPSLLEVALYRLAARWASMGDRTLAVTFVDYHEARLIDTYALAEYMLAEGLDPAAGLKMVYLATVYNRRQAVELDYERLLQRTGAGLVVLYRLSRLFRQAAHPLLLKALSRAKAVMARGVPLVLMVDESARRGWPDAPAYVLHFASSAVWLRGRRGSYVEARLVKSAARPEAAKTFTGRLSSVEGWF
ncbi:hypothetical protein [Infirmifilum sp. NZ]|uniref:hypothetical protein n=1 Tax=Infirmifilum sp. NZ TaxID=2926850 RepID=UPI0027A73E4B|nr:hypothetical protein [Infirmifilum sp. NZ]UNQ73628.1 hypothetical protein MOV14_01100 [Infirmifilum sp. NZ]